MSAERFSAEVGATKQLDAVAWLVAAAVSRVCALPATTGQVSLYSVVGRPPLLLASLGCCLEESLSAGACLCRLRLYSVHFVHGGPCVWAQRLQV